MSIEKRLPKDPLADAASLEMIQEMPESEIAAMRAAVVRELPTQAPIFLPTGKISLREQVTGLMRVRDIYRNRLDSVYRPRLRALKERFKHRRQRCFVIGNGPSLNRTDLAMLKDEVTFAVNGFFLKARELDWLPTFYVVEDHLVAEDRREAIEAFRGTTKLFPVYLGYCFRESDDTIFFNHRPRKSYPHGFDFSTEADQVTYTGCTVTFSCLQLAYYLGFQEIYLIGVDSDYAIPTDAQHAKDYGVGVIDMKSDDTNHFHPDYFGKGFRWHDPQVHKMLEAYAEARVVTDRTGRSILNATVGGKLDVFERVAFTSIFPNARSPEEMDRLRVASLPAIIADARNPGEPCEQLRDSNDEALPKNCTKSGESRTQTADLQHTAKVTIAEETGIRDHQNLTKLPRLLIFDITKRGDGTATGEIKATLFAGWPDDRIVQFYSIGRDQIGVAGVVPEVLRRNKSFVAEDISRVARWFCPDIILYRPVPDNLALHEAAMNLIRSSDLPLAIWIMDDWPSRLAVDDPALFARLDSDLRELLARAALRLSICDAMSAAFAERYGVSFKAFANAIDPAEWPLRERGCDKQGPFVLRYAGGLARDMGLMSVRRAAQVVERLANEGLNIRFEISTRPYWHKMAEPEFRQFKNTVFRVESFSPAQYRQWLSEADSLLVAYNFDDASKRYVRFSLANKLPECLASGAVLIAHGPPDIASIEYIQSLDCAIVVSSDADETFAAALKDLAQNAPRRLSLSLKARDVAFSSLNVHRVREDLRCEFRAISLRRDENAEGGIELPEYERAVHAHVDELQVISVLLGTSGGKARTLVSVGAELDPHSRHFFGTGWQIYCAAPEPRNQALAKSPESGADASIVCLSESQCTEAHHAHGAFVEGMVGGGHPVVGSSGEQAALCEVNTVADIVRQRRTERLDVLLINTRDANFDILREIPWDHVRPEVILCAFSACTQEQRLYLQSMAKLLIENGYAVYVSEWHTVAGDGAQRDWCRLARCPQEIRTSDSCGRLLAFLTDPGAASLAYTLDICVRLNSSEVQKSEGRCESLDTGGGSAAAVVGTASVQTMKPPEIERHEPAASGEIYSNTVPLENSPQEVLHSFSIIRSGVADRSVSGGTFRQLVAAASRVIRERPRPLAGLLLTAFVLAAASVFAPMWGYSFLLWSGAAASLVLAMALIAGAAAKEAVLRLLSIQKMQMESRLQEHLCDLREDLAELDSKLAALVSSLPNLDSGSLYSQVVHRICELATTALPKDATVLVISNGDDQLLRVHGRKASHFPQTEDGGYAGYHPVDSPAVIAHLEALRGKGANFLLVPNTAFWWFDHYHDFKFHLDRHYQLLSSSESCIIYNLAVASISAEPGHTQRHLETSENVNNNIERVVREVQRGFDQRIVALESQLNALEQSYRYMRAIAEIRQVVRQFLPSDSLVLVVSKGDEELLRLDVHQAWHFPQTEDGVYAGHHPADCAAAISHLEALRRQGAHFLLVPATAFWWLRYYADFRQHLLRNYRIVHEHDCCIIYDILQDSGSDNSGDGHMLTACPQEPATPQYAPLTQGDYDWFSPNSTGELDA